jgi:hypothetical protein
VDVPAEETREVVEAREPGSAQPFRRQLLVAAALATATVVLDLIARPLAEGHYFAWRQILAISLAFAHGTLAAVWVVWGGRASPWRFVAAWVAMVACLAAFVRRDDGPFFDNTRCLWLWLMAVQMVAVSVLLFLVRFTGVELREGAGDAGHVKPEPPAQWLQFSLWSLLEWTAATAVVLAASRYLPRIFLNHLMEVSVELLILLGPSIPVGIASVWAVLGARWTAVRLAALVGAVVGGVVVLGALVAAPPAALWEFTWFLTAQVAYLAVALGVARRWGCRLVWRRRTRL